MFSMVFPGQGSQSVGMLASLAVVYPEIQKTFEEASQVLGYDLWALTQQGPAEQLDTTEYTQPAMLAGGIAVFRAWRAEGGIMPQMLAGHSLGEYTAWVIADALSFSDALHLVALRGRCMQEAVPLGQGAMAAVIGLDSVAIQTLCDAAAEGDVLAPANINSAQQIVIAGSAEAIARALVLAKSHGAKLAKQLPMSVPSHCALMLPAAQKLSAALASVAINEPTIPVVNNVDVASVQTPDAIRDALTRQLTHPVRWVEIIQWMESQGMSHCIECGPGAVLSGLNKRITSVSCVSIQTPESLAEEVCRFKKK